MVFVCVGSSDVCSSVRGFDRRLGRGDHDRLVGAAAGDFLVVVVAGVAGHPVVGAGGRGARAVGRFVGARAVDRDRAVGGGSAERRVGTVGGRVELPGDRADGVFAELAGERGLVLEAVADDAGGGLQCVSELRLGRRHHYRLVGAAAGDFLVVVVAGVAGHPVVGAGGRGARAVGRFVGARAVDRDRAVGGDQAAFGALAFVVRVELPGDRAAGVFAEQAGERGLVLEGVADGARGGLLGGFDRDRKSVV